MQTLENLDALVYQTVQSLYPNDTIYFRCGDGGPHPVDQNGVDVKVVLYRTGLLYSASQFTCVFSLCLMGIDTLDTNKLLEAFVAGVGTLGAAGLVLSSDESHEVKAGNGPMITIKLTCPWT